MTVGHAEKRARRIGTFVVIGTAALTWWGIKSQVLQAYPVRTPSMEPTIEGDLERGDLVLVDKTFDNRALPERFDTIVFRQSSGGFPENAASKILVKRVVGLPGEYIRIRGFDLWVGSDPNRLERVVKSPVDHADLLLDYWTHERDPRGFESKLWRVEGARITPRGIEMRGGARNFESLFPPSRFRSTGIARRPRWRAEWQLGWSDGSILVGYLDAFGNRQASLPACIDFGVRTRVVADGEASLWIDLRYGDASWALHYDARGRAELWHNGEAVRALGAVDVPPIRTETGDGAAGDRRSREVLFMHLDGGFVLVVDQVLRFRHEVPLAELRIEPQRRKAWNGLGIATSAGRVVLEELSIVQDIHYLEMGSYAIHEAHPTPSDAVFVLGDNSRDSRDSRQHGSVELTDLVGRPIAILAPGGRRRLLRR